MKVTSEWSLAPSVGVCDSSWRILDVRLHHHLLFKIKNKKKRKEKVEE